MRRDCGMATKRYDVLALFLVLEIWAGASIAVCHVVAISFFAAEQLPAEGQLYGRGQFGAFLVGQEFDHGPDAFQGLRFWTFTFVSVNLGHDLAHHDPIGFYHINTYLIVEMYIR
jgi:hypothetical protein